MSGYSLVIDMSSQPRKVLWRLGRNRTRSARRTDFGNRFFNEYHGRVIPMRDLRGVNGEVHAVACQVPPE